MRPRPATQQEQVVHGFSEDALYRLTGLMIVSILPALFWTGVLALTGSAFGVLPSSLALATVGAAIAAFLAAVANALFTKVS
jgi:hypothetical protein